MRWAATGGQLYVGLSAETVTIGFRIYSWASENTLRRVGIPRALKNDVWLERRRKRLARKYESYWYSAEKGKWTKHLGWPRETKEWKKCKGWIVRKKLAPLAATRPRFVKDVEKTFRELFPLLAFSSLSEWKR